jgi:hypothetical protein
MRGESRHLVQQDLVQADGLAMIITLRRLLRYAAALTFRGWKRKTKIMSASVITLSL